MDWSAAELRHDPGTVETRVFGGMVRIAQTRARLLALRAGTPAQLLDTGDDHVLAIRRRHPRSGSLIALANFCDEPVRLDRQAALPGLHRGAQLVLAGDGSDLTAYEVTLPAWGHAWVADV
jgi:amylosucrase